MQDPAAWVSRIAQREALRLLVQAGRGRASPEPDGGPPELATPDDAAAARQRLDVRLAVSRLTPAEREALLLHYWGDLTNRQVAAALNLPLATVKLRIFRARAKLERTLGAGA